MVHNPEDTTKSDDQPAQPDKPPDQEERLVELGLKYLERGMLLLVVLLTLAAAYGEILTVLDTGSVQLGDVLLMFLYTEVIAMVAVFYTGRGQPFVFPIFIAITALARLIVLQGKEMDPMSILVEASAILLLAIAAILLLRFIRN